MKLTYKAAQQAAEIRLSYGEYIQESIQEKVDRGIYSQEFADNADLGTLLIGNDGE
jgi:hypothetical protein